MTHQLMQGLRLFCHAEQKLQDLLQEFAARFPGMELQLQGSIPDLGLTIQSKQEQESRLQTALDWLLQELGPDLYSTQGQSLPAVLGDILSKQGLGLALAESCTGGLIAHMLTDVPGSSEYFLFSAVTYSNHSKINVLGVKQDSLQQNGAVHEQIAEEMAAGARCLADADYALASTGIAGPTGGSQNKPVGTVCLGLAGPNWVSSSLLQTGISDRGRNKHYFALAALDLLRRQLE
ncbi:MAG: CinA family protein [Desulfohalobiaceae bacterium]